MNEDKQRSMEAQISQSQHAQCLQNLEWDLVHCTDNDPPPPPPPELCHSNWTPSFKILAKNLFHYYVNNDYRIRVSWYKLKTQGVYCPVVFKYIAVWGFDIKQGMYSLVFVIKVLNLVPQFLGTFPNWLYVGRSLFSKI